jgi:protein subunit release factor B
MIKDKRLLFSVTKKDFDVQHFCSGGPGGQHQNKTASGCRIIHRDSGAVGESREYRSQAQNKQAAFKRLVETQKFKLWLKIESSRKMGEETPEQYVEKEMRNEKHLKLEVKENNQWKVVGLNDNLLDEQAEQ